MTITTDETHDPDLTSWVESANDPATDFPIQNLPLGVFRRLGGPPRPGAAIGNQILDLSEAAELRLVDTAALPDLHAGTLNQLMLLPRSRRAALRADVSRLLSGDAGRARGVPAFADRLLLPMAEAEMLLPALIGDYTDFYTSVFHATNLGRMFRPDSPLMPNYRWVPIGYHGRASSIVVSGTPVRRPYGQTRGDDAEKPEFGPTRVLDYELEVGIYAGPGNEHGLPVPISAAEEHIFGLCLVNDWSARDIQRWEYQPLGPFLSKSFATSVSPWIITLEALAPFRVPAFERPAGDPPPLPYLSAPNDRSAGGFDIRLEALISTLEMRKRGAPPHRICSSNTKDLYWTFAQMLAHHTSNGCNLRSGDLLASGTVSGAADESQGCLLERTQRGTQPIRMPTGEERRFLEDGDEVILRGWCERPGFRRIGFGECRSIILPAAQVIASGCSRDGRPSG